MSDSQFDARYELLAAILGAYSDPQTRPVAVQVDDN